MYEIHKEILGKLMREEFSKIYFWD